MTKANTEGLYCGVTDIPLCEEGESELYSILENYSYPYVEKVYSSPLLRARQTAEIIFPEYDVALVDELSEANFGVFENRSLEELKNDKEFQKFIAPKSNYIPKGVEPPQDFYNRCSLAFTNIVEEMMQNGIFSAAVITHAAVIGNILSSLAYPKAAPYDWQCGCGCGFTVIADPTIYIREPVVEVIAEIPVENINELDD